MSDTITLAIEFPADTRAKDFADLAQGALVIGIAALEGITEDTQLATRLGVSRQLIKKKRDGAASCVVMARAGRFAAAITDANAVESAAVLPEPAPLPVAAAIAPEPAATNVVPLQPDAPQLAQPVLQPETDATVAALAAQPDPTAPVAQPDPAAAAAQVQPQAASMPAPPAAPNAADPFLQQQGFTGQPSPVDGSMLYVRPGIDPAWLTLEAAYAALGYAAPAAAQAVQPVAQPAQVAPAPMPAQPAPMPAPAAQPAPHTPMPTPPGVPAPGTDMGSTGPVVQTPQATPVGQPGQTPVFDPNVGVPSTVFDT